MFSITGGKGFKLTFENGWTVSVQWGAGNYGSNYNTMEYRNPFVANPNLSKYDSETAEVAAWDKDGVWLQVTEYDQVRGYCTAEEVAAFIAHVAALPKVPEKIEGVETLALPAGE